NSESSGLFGDRTTLEWTQDADGRYEVATAEHLVQIMERGQRFVDDGDFPPDHWGASASYIQTADIDLQNWHAKIRPIGNVAANFYGQYDGGGKSISNWSYTQPEDSATVSSTGLFGVVTNAEIKRVRLNGAWTLNGSGHASTYLGDGFLCGTVSASTVYDVEGDFSSGTLMAGGSSTTAPVTHRVGCLIGNVSDSVVCKATVSGTVDLKDFGGDGHNTYVGGVIGYIINAGSSVSLCRNVAFFPNGITGNAVGGVAGYFHMGLVSTCLNAMQGDVVGVSHAGGICGIHAAGGSCDTVVNSMTGHIQSAGNAGGIHGCVDASGTGTLSSSQLINYMRGDVASSSTNAGAGGLVGLVTRSADTEGDVNITNSIVAMHGRGDHAVCGAESFVPSAIEVVENTDFGMVVPPSASATTTTLTGFTTNAAFTDLPYIPLVATDPDGVMSEIDFVFANLGGKGVYSSLFTHLSLHTSTVSAPYPTDFGLDNTQAAVYLTYANLDAGQIFVDETLTIVETAAEVAFNHSKSVVLLGTASLPLICEPRAVVVKANIDASGSPFRLTYQEISQGLREVVAHDEFTETLKIIQGLTPETTYVISLYANDTLVDKVLVTTAANTADNYNVTDFYVHDEELYDISKVGDQVMSAANDLFATGDAVTVAIGNNNSTKTTKTTFVNRGGQVDVAGLRALLLPFESEVLGTTQDATITLSDASTVSVGFDVASGDVLVGGASYGSGDHFVLDGQKVCVFAA
ncbi:unnamed protein product, partial [Hapterophycus canaliculatus]